MRTPFSLTLSIALLLIAGSATAEPDMRCRLDGAYIKVYGKNEGEQRAICERQGGELTRYVAPQPHEQSSPSSNALHSMMGR